MGGATSRRTAIRRERNGAATAMGMTATRTTVKWPAVPSADERKPVADRLTSLCRSVELPDFRPES
jgi:hypothetical protein